MFKEQYIKNWQQIAWTYPRGTIRNRRAQLILKSHAIDIIRTKELRPADYLLQAMRAFKP